MSWTPSASLSPTIGQCLWALHHCASAGNFHPLPFLQNLLLPVLIPGLCSGKPPSLMGTQCRGLPAASPQPHSAMWQTSCQAVGQPVMVDFPASIL